MGLIRVYTKPIVDKLYDAGLANSVHFSFGQAKETMVELNQGYGILFAKGEIILGNTISARGANNPRIARMSNDEKAASVQQDCEDSTDYKELLERKDRYLIIADYVDEQGENVAPGSFYCWTTCDFVSFADMGLLTEANIRAMLNAVVISDKGSENESAGAADAGETLNELFSNEIEIPDSFTEEITYKWIPIPAKMEIKYPRAIGYADPVLFKWDGKWYFLATNDLNGNVGLFLREADTIEELFSESGEGIGEKARESVILDYNEEKGFIQTFWAPEWHIIGGVPYILFAVGPKQWGPQCHMMKYKGSGSIMEPSSWEEPEKVLQADGKSLTEFGITLDMTHFEANGRDYVAWSERYNIGTSLDSGSMIYIGEIDAKNPTRLISDKILISRPFYGWENVAGTINNEGPYPLIHDGIIYLSYSGGAAVGHTYAVGYLVAKENADLLDPESWQKQIWPSLSAYSIEGIDGPGHNSFFVDDEGNTMVAYHGQLKYRSSYFHKVRFNKYGYPELNMSQER